MADQSGFFDELKDWSDRKIDLVTDYIDGAARILGSGSFMYYIDGFAGPGIYGDGATGSPVRIAELARRCEEEGRGYHLRCINVEAKRARFRNLQTATAPFGPLVTNMPGQFSVNADPILQLIGHKPAVFFLDPFGIKGIPWHVVRAIVARDAPTDLWIRLDERLVRRIEGFYGHESREARGKYERTLCSLYGIADPADLHAQLDAPTADLRLDRARTLYKERLRQAIERERGRTAYAGSYNIKSVSAQHKYALIFGTAHPKGITLASDTVHNIEKEYQADRTKVTFQPGLFDAHPSDRLQKPIDDLISEDLATAIHQRYGASLVDRLTVHAGLTEQHFGLFGKRHVTMALNLLLQRRSATLLKGPVSRDDAQFRFTPGV